MKGQIAFLALLVSTLAPASRALAADFPDTGKPLLAQGPVQTAPPAERPYGRWSTPRNPTPQGPPGARYAQPYASYYTEIRVAPLYGGTTFVYDGPTVVGSIPSGAGTLFVPQGRVYGVVVTRGDRVVWQGQIMATPGMVALSFDQYGSAVVERVPPPPPQEFPAPTVGRAVSPLEFRDALAAMGSLSDDASRLDWVYGFFTGRPVTVGQTSDVLGQFTYEDTRLRALGILAPNLVDRVNASRLLGSFTTESGRARAAAMIGLP